MKHEVIFLGKTKDSFIQKGISEYLSRLKHYTDFQITTLKDKTAGKGGGQIIKAQGEQLLNAVPKDSLIVALDAGGKQFTSEKFSEQIVNWENRGVKHISYLIGGPDGISPAIIEKSRLVLSLSKMTFTHDMIRMLLLEQIYRSYTIKNGEKYHK